MPPEFCTNSPYDSNKCVNVTRYPNGTKVTTYNSLCYGQDPNPNFEHFYCSYPRARNLTSPGLCCPEGTYASYDTLNHVWTCKDSENCGVTSSYPCLYDFDLNNTLWKNSQYGGGSKWCQSKMPYLYSPEIVPTMNTACCLMAKDGSVDYFTDAGNVKIFGFQPVCGDGVVSSQAPCNEQCDGSVTTTCVDYVTCSGINVPTGTVTCSNSCQIVHSSCHCAIPSQGGQNQN